MMLFMNSGAEIAFFSLGLNDLKNMRIRRYPTAERILGLLRDPALLLSSLLVGNLFYRIMIILLCNQLLLAAYFPGWPVIAVFLVRLMAAVVLLLLFGEFLPKVWASHNPIRFAFYASYLVQINHLLFRLPGKWMSRLSGKIENALGWEKSKIDRLHQIDEVIAMGGGDATSEEEKNILKGIARFGDITVRKVMRSRLDVQGVEATIDFDTLKRNVAEQQYSRFPVYKGSLDTIAGMVHAKDLIPHLGKPADFDWQQLIRPAFFIHEQMLVNDLLKAFQEKQKHFAIVVDEFGGTDGIVTMEDILEEIVGEIRDEYDDEESLNVRLDEHNYIFEGRIMINDACKIMRVPGNVFESVRGGSETMAGLLLEIAGEIPQNNQVFTVQQFTFTVMDVTMNRIQKLKVTIDPTKV
jgi:gliding motility-associated protein GldE